MYLGLDPARTENPYPDGRIIGINRTRNGLLDALVAKGRTRSHFTLANNRIQTIDETDSSVWDPAVTLGWYLIGGVVMQLPPPLEKDEYNLMVGQIKQLFQIVEDEGVSKILDRRTIAPRTLAGSTWLDDIAHGWLKPTWRSMQIKLEAWRAHIDGTTPAAHTKVAAEEEWTGLQREMETLGLVWFYSNADPSLTEWRHSDMLAGTERWRTATTPNGDGHYGREAGSRELISYPTGESVATWDIVSAIEGLEEIA